MNQGACLKDQLCARSGAGAGYKDCRTGLFSKGVPFTHWSTLGKGSACVRVPWLPSHTSDCSAPCPGIRRKGGAEERFNMKRLPQAAKNPHQKGETIQYVGLWACSQPYKLNLNLGLKFPREWVLSKGWEVWPLTSEVHGTVYQNILTLP